MIYITDSLYLKPQHKSTDHNGNSKRVFAIPVFYILNITITSMKKTKEIR